MLFGETTTFKIMEINFDDNLFEFITKELIELVWFVIIIRKVGYI